MKKIALREKSFARQKDYSFTAKAEETRCTSENKRGLKKCKQKKTKKKCLCLQSKNFPVWCLDASKHLKNVRATRNQYLVYFIKSVATHQEKVPTSLLPTSCLKQTIPFQIFYRLSSTNLTWSILEYFVPYTNLILI